MQRKEYEFGGRMIALRQRSQTNSVLFTGTTRVANSPVSITVKYFTHEAAAGLADVHQGSS